MNYFRNKDECMARARAHTEEMTAKYRTEIVNCIRKSEILGRNDLNKFQVFPTFPVTDLQNVYIIDKTTTDAIFHEDWMYKYNPIPSNKIMDYGTAKIAVLNFASFKNPGGMFINGSMAQEESLCHASFLYNVLSQFQDTFYAKNKNLLNRSLYTNRGIYSPNVIFEHTNLDGSREYVKVDVFTIAAPNAGAARRIGVSEQDITAELRRRIRFVIQSILDHGPYLSVILGAFGCGVFKNDPEVVARMFFKELDNMECRDKFYRVIFAIVGDNNIQPFQKLLDERRESFGKIDLPEVSMDFNDSSVYSSRPIDMDMTAIED